MTDKFNTTEYLKQQLNRSVEQLERIRPAIDEIDAMTPVLNAFFPKWERTSPAVITIRGVESLMEILPLLEVFDKDGLSWTDSGNSWAEWGERDFNRGDGLRIEVYMKNDGEGCFVEKTMVLKPVYQLNCGGKADAPETAGGSDGVPF